MKILGIETSCDETAAALLEIKKRQVKILGQTISSQIKIHREFGGIIPEVAARNHLTKILPIIAKVLQRQRRPTCLSSRQMDQTAKNHPLLSTIFRTTEIDVIAVTQGPGLITSLLVGIETARTLAYVWQKPVVAVNHLEGHIYANSIDQKKLQIINFKFPTLALIISGGHTELILMKNHGHYKIVGQTLDDAAGETLDKVAKLLEIGYPGGPVIERLARLGNPEKIDLPRPMIHSQNFNFSFSGLKTAVLYKNKKIKSAGLSNCQVDQTNRIKNQEYLANMSAAVQQATIDVLISKTIRAAQKYQVKTVLLSGGVAANSALRDQFKKSLKEKLPKIVYLVPDHELSTDNALMIALAGYFNAQRKNFTPWQKLKVNPNLKLA